MTMSANILSSVTRNRDYEPADHPEDTHNRRPPRPKKEKPAPPPPPAPKPRGQPRKDPVLPPIYKRGKDVSIEDAVAVADFNVAQGLEGTVGRIIEGILLALPEMHALQLRIIASPAKRKVINCGRRVGKTTMAAHEATVKMCEGRRVLIASTTQEQADAAWEKLTTWLAPFIDAGYLKKNEARRVIEFEETGGRIRCKTARDEDTLRGDYADFAIFDECALLAEKAWTEVGAPMLLDNDGDAWFLSTPRRRNWFFGLHSRALVDTTGRWETFHATSFDNPHLSEAALAEITTDLTDDGYKQEILAEFLEGEGQVFRNISACMHAPLPADPKAHQNHRVVGGLDWGRIKDSTVLCVFCATCMQELLLDRFNKIDWNLQQSRIVNDYHTWYISYILAEENSIGGPNRTVLVNDHHLNIEGFQTQTASKAELVQMMSLALERGDAQWQDIPLAKAELEGFEGKTSPKTNVTTYEAAPGTHDDTVIGRMLALRAALSGQGISAPEARTYAELASVANYGEGGYDDEDNDWVGVISHAPVGNSIVGQYDGSYGSHALKPPPGRPW